MMRALFPFASAALAATLLAVAPTTGWARQSNGAAAATAPPLRLPANAAVVPFSVGEKLEYDVKFGSLKVGSGSMEVRDLVDVHGLTTWHTIFRITGGITFYRVNEGSYERKRRYEFFPERGMYKEGDKPEQPTVEAPLDDGSFLYFVRTIPLEVGKEYSFNRYFNPASNPVTIKVLRRETVKVPAGTFNAVVLQPMFKTKGIFSENGRAEVWITDDSRRMMVQMKSKLSIGSLNLYLRAHNTATP